jgi:F-type H+-transporting ATPase subunit epsilon
MVFATVFGWGSDDGYLMTTFPFSILTPGGTIVSGDVTQVQVRTYVGALGVMAGHEPLVAACPAGTVSIQQEGVWVSFKTDASLLTADGAKVTVLTSSAQYSGRR